jgi:hypothetical protein
MLLLAALCGQSQAATYFVANPDPGTSMAASANGSEAEPWPTISHALSQLQGGDTLFVKPGLYQEASLLIPGTISGTPANPARIQALPGGSVILCGPGRDTGQVKLAACSNLVFAGFIITNFSQGIILEGTTDVTVQDCVIQHIGQEALSIRGNARQVRVQGCSISQSGAGQPTGSAISVGSGPTEPLDNTRGVTLRSNLIYRVAGSAIELKPGTYACNAERNTIYDVRPGGQRGAIEVSESRSGVQQWTANPNHHVSGNLLHDTGTAIRVSTGCRVVNNLIYHLAPGACGIVVMDAVGDGYPRFVYHNTIDIPSDRAVLMSAGAADVRNNLGPVQTNNLAADASFFVNGVGHDYHLAPGSPPVDAGLDLITIVGEDREGTRRPRGRGVDLGAYERVPARPAPPGGLRIIPSRP